MNNVVQELNTVKDLVTYILCNHPETRNDDTLLYLECCKKLGATQLEDIADLGLNIISVHKIRQLVQNKEKKFMPDENVQKIRNQRRNQVREYMKYIS